MSTLRAGHPKSRGPFPANYEKSILSLGIMTGVGILPPGGVARNFVWGGGSTNSVEDRGQRERGSGGGSSLVRSSGGSCNLVQEISFHIVKFS